VQEAIPEVASEPVTVTWTGWLYQPFVSAPRCAAMAAALGGVASRLIVTAAPTTLPSLRSTVQRKSIPFVSALTVWLPQPVGLLNPLPERLNETVTSLVYHPLLQAEAEPATVQLGVIVTSACAAAGSESETAATAAASAASFIAPPRVPLPPRKRR
jgi:hypothetical protein